MDKEDRLISTRRIYLILAFIVYIKVQCFANNKSIDFDKTIRPILSDKCFHCHGPDPRTREADFRIDTREGALAKLKSGGFAIVPNEPDKGEMMARILTHDEDDLMPPPKSNKALTQKEKGLLREWIKQGVPWSEHWAFVSPKKNQLPKVKNTTWPKNEIDFFILSKLDELGLKPENEANPLTLLRRISLDLRGLPVSEAEIKEFLSDQSNNRYEKWVDRFLSSKEYGERMAWPWLDVARYSDTNGYQHDAERQMWPWRDWVVRALNNNMPFDQFTIEQLAGDLLKNSTREQKLASAFNRNHMINGEGGRIGEENRVEYIYDQLETVGTAWLGLTFNCSRCHDHKYDPLKQEEYFNFFAYFNQSPVNGVERSAWSKPYIQYPTSKQENELKRLKAQFENRKRELSLLKKETEKLYKKVSLKKKDNKKGKAPEDERIKIKNTEIANLNKQIKHLERVIPKVMVMQNRKDYRKTYILEKGLYNQRGREVGFGIPAVLKTSKEEPKDRLGLAKWLLHKDHPLTSRVVVNRFWAQVFGIGLVKTTENFGVQGERPKNPELLDWLAVEFIEKGWNVKQLMKLMLMSATYKQSSVIKKHKLDMDPHNRYLSRGARYRIPSWMIRDQALAASGLLVNQQGGPSVKPYQPSGIWAELTFGKKRYKRGNGDDLYRRSLYTYWRRIVAPTMLFDVASRQTCSVKDIRTNTPLHALTTLNDITYNEAAKMLAQKAIVNKLNDKQTVQFVFRSLLTREAKDVELNIMMKRLEQLRQQFTKTPEDAKKYLNVGEAKTNPNLNSNNHAALAALCLAIINLDETLNRE